VTPFVLRVIRRAVIVSALLAATPFVGAPSVGAQKTALQHTDVNYTAAFTRGVEAFRRGELHEAARAFQDAYLIRPTDPELKSWMALVGDEQKRREMMTFTLDDTEARPEHVAAATEHKPPLWKRLFLPSRAPLGLGGAVTPPEEGRREILEEGKRAGFQRLYKEGIGFQPVPGLGFSGRTEIFEEPNPVDDYILEAKISGFDSLSEYRHAITPLYTRSWATRAVADYEPLPRLTYEFDKRDIFHELDARFGVKDRRLETHAFNALYTFPHIPLLGYLTVNPWYKRVFQEADHDAGSFEDKDELITNFSLQTTEDLELFFQYNAAEAEKTKIPGGSVTQLFKGQVRMRFPQWKLFIIPSYEYSGTDFLASEDELIKRDFFVDWGVDITPRMRASSKERYVLLKQSQPTSSPTYAEAKALSFENTLSYELFKDFDVSVGLDYAKGIGLNAFNNVGLRAEMELFKPGLLRAKLGYEYLSYYNIEDDLSLLFFRLFLFQ